MKVNFVNNMFLFNVRYPHSEYKPPSQLELKCYTGTGFKFHTQSLHTSSFTHHISMSHPNVLSSSYYNSSSVCLFVPLLLWGPLTDLRQTCWVYVGGPRNCPWGVLFLKGQRVNWSTGQTSLFPSRRHQAETTPLQNAHGVFCWARRLLPSKRHTPSKSLIPSMGIFTSNVNSF